MVGVAVKGVESKYFLMHFLHAVFEDLSLALLKESIQREILKDRSLQLL